MIQYDEKHRIFKLDTPHTSYVFGLSDQKYPGHIYYGKSLGDTDLAYLLREEEMLPPSVRPRRKVNFLDEFPMEYPFGGTGDTRESCIDILTEDGQAGLEPTYAGHRILDHKPALEGLPATWGENVQTLEADLRDEVTGLLVTLSYSVFDDTDAVIRSVRVKNCGERPIRLTRVLSACLHLEQPDAELVTLPGHWGREKRMQRQGVGYGGLTAESVRGTSGHQAHPFMGLVSKDCTQKGGEVWAMNLVYSGDFLAKTTKDPLDQIRMVMGIHPQRFCWELKPGDTFQAPEAVLVYSDEGFGKMTRTFHFLYRNHLMRGDWVHRQRPVLINNWEATMYDFDTEKLLSFAREASKAGIEMLVMDDGWFGHRNDDDSSLGDWYVNEEKLPGGLPYLAEQVNALGMKLGIWFEPEMISEDSDLYRAHPDWALQVNGRRPGLARDQLVLDFSRPEVVDGVYAQIREVLSSANIEYVKWDMNRPLTDIGNAVLPPGRQGEIVHRYMLGVYSMLERLLTDFPHLLLESCSSGGGRFDAGMLYYSPQIWGSDDSDAIERLSIQEGEALLYPLSAIGAHVSDCPNQFTGRTVPFETRGIVALGGTFGYELDITKIPEEERALIPGQVEMYKRYNDLIREGEYYRLESYYENHQYDSYMVVSEDGAEALLVTVQVFSRVMRCSRRLCLQGLEPDAFYEVDRKHYQGATLMQAGLLIPNARGDYQAQLIPIRRV